MMIERLRRANGVLAEIMHEIGITFSLLNDVIPVQVRRFFRIVAMSIVSVALLEIAGLDGSESAILAAAATAAQEVLHRWLAPATPDREKTRDI